MKRKYYDRAFTADLSEESNPNVISFSLASPDPCLREKDGMIYQEVLEISERAIDFTRLIDNRSPLLLEHERTKQIGVVEKAWIDGDRLYVTVRFSENDYPQKILADIKAGIRRNVSLGYEVFKKKATGDMIDGYPVYMVTSWRPFEVSIVSVPADCTVRSR